MTTSIRPGCSCAHCNRQRDALLVRAAELNAEARELRTRARDRRGDALTLRALARDPALPCVVERSQIRGVPLGIRIVPL